jgi:hypothetical protein
MTKVMFQVGLLAFFIAAILFGTQGMPLMDMILRAFIVFIATVLVQAIIFVMVASMKSPKKAAREVSHPDHNHAGLGSEPAQQPQQSATPS